jgi:hypothetical protein
MKSLSSYRNAIIRLARRRDARFGDYVAQLMDRLDIAHVALEDDVARERQAVPAK